MVLIYLWIFHVSSPHKPLATVEERDPLNECDWDGLPGPLDAIKMIQSVYCTQSWATDKMAKLYWWKILVLSYDWDTDLLSPPDNRRKSKMSHGPGWDLDKEEWKQSAEKLKRLRKMSFQMHIQMHMQRVLVYYHRILLSLLLSDNGH